jgi:hypothetical protein
MAINSVILEVVAKVAQKLPQAPRRMLCLGYPDMLVTEPQLAALLGADAAAKVTYREDSASILRWHKLEGQIPRIAETRSVFGALGIESDFVDIVASRGFETVVDLNHQAPEELHGRYDIVYDGGTTEHCFNVGQVMRNICSFARVGGFIIHVNPMNYYNHGFFNLNPTFYHDWYTQSGNTVVSPFYAIYGPVLSAQVGTLDATASFRAPERAALMVAIAKTSAAEPGWPMQSKYLQSPTLRA